MGLYEVYQIPFTQSLTAVGRTAKINAQRQNCKRVLTKSKHQCPATVGDDRARNKKNKDLSLLE